jgi:hypothetical protein
MLGPDYKILYKPLEENHKFGKLKEMDKKPVFNHAGNILSSGNFGQKEHKPHI